MTNMFDWKRVLDIFIKSHFASTCMFEFFFLCLKKKSKLKEQNFVFVVEKKNVHCLLLP